jgi:hypothetical protein
MVGGSEHRQRKRHGRSQREQRGPLTKAAAALAAGKLAVRGLPTYKRVGHQPRQQFDGPEAVHILVWQGEGPSILAGAGGIVAELANHMKSVGVYNHSHFLSRE